MKQQWLSDELLAQWMLSASEREFINKYQTDTNRLGCALLLKCAQIDGKFPQRKQDIQKQIVEYVAQQIHVPGSAFDFYPWRGGTNDRHRLHIRRFLKIKIGTVAIAQEITVWLAKYILLQEERQFEQLKRIVYERYRELKIEPPQPKRIERLIRSGIRTADEQFYATTMGKLSAQVRSKLDTLLSPAILPDGTTDNISMLQHLRSEPGATTLDSVLTEIEKLNQIRSLLLPPDLFSQATRKVVSWYRQRVAVEDLPEIRRHPAKIRYTLLSAYCYQREQEIIDTLVDLLINLIHRIEKRAKQTVNKEIIRDVKRIEGKHKLLYEVAQASIEKPEGTVKEVIYPVVSEKTLHDLVEEYKSDGSYDQKVQVLMRGSYGNHYRRMVPLILKALTFSSTTTAPKPLLAALDLIKKYADQPMVFYPNTEEVPLEDVVPKSWLPLVKRGQQVNRISYELCVLMVSRDKFRCKEIWVHGANRYRNPEEDLPMDFEAKRNEYYAELELPLSADKFIAAQKQEMKAALEMFDRDMPKNQKVKLTTRKRKAWIKLTPLDRQPEPQNLTRLKAEVGQRWGQLFLLDVFKEAALRLGLSDFFKSPALYETMSREVLQVRLILCLYALGTNIGLKRIVSGLPEKYGICSMSATALSIKTASEWQ